MKKPDEATIKSSAENQELEKAKDYYLNKNIEIEQLIQQVMKGDITPPKGMNLPGKSLMDKSPEGIESLLRFLIYLVLHKEKMSPEENMTFTVFRPEVILRRVLYMITVHVSQILHFNS